MKSLRKLSSRLRSLLLILVIAFGQIASATGPFISLQKAVAAPICVEDTAGANDEPGQKDLTQLCEDDAPAAGTEVVSWNWDDRGTSGGGQSLDACGLFDSDGDGFINYSICVTTKNDPAVKDTVTIYTCTADSKVDRCGGPDDIAGNYATTCTVTQQNTDPFPAGNFSPLDTVAACNFVLADLPVPETSLNLVDVCSYPSREPNSDPSDCVIIQTNPVALIEVIKDVVPNSAGGLFNLSVDGPVADDTTVVNDVPDGGSTGVIALSPPNNGGTAVVSETAGTGTNLANYTSSISCVDRGTTNVVASGQGTSLQVPVSDLDDIVCTITNTAFGSITIVKDALPNHAQDFAFSATGAGTNNFSLDDDSGAAGADATLNNSISFANLGSGAYTFTESQVSGWDLTNLTCSAAATINQTDRTVTINLTAGQNITCTFTNTKRGHLIVQKTTLPANDPTVFSINASGTGTITGGGAGTITDALDKDYEVTPGTYSVAETVPAGWSKTGDTCQNVVVAPGATVTCLITNTKHATLNIIKDALPNHAQNFGFTTTNLGGATFNLDDDADPTLSNTQSFTGLLPGTYTVTELATPGWSLTGLTCDTNNFNANNPTVSVNLAAGQTTNCTFTNTKLVSISGTKYTSNALASFGPVLAGWTIFIDSNNNGILDQGELSAITDVNGDYSFVDLLPGTFTLAEVLQAGWTQIFAPGTFSLAAGETAVDKDFGNFQNGSISGFKWNDLNGNGTKQDNEPRLNGWTITLYDANNQPIGNPVVTSGNGDYSFTNLAPGTYSVCETAQANWIQTFPANNGCHTIVIDQSGESNTANFGNQGRGTIRVIKNVDSDGDGDVDFPDVTNWTWDINGSGNFATGSGNVQNVAAGTYTVSEDQQTNFHVVSVVCDTQVNAVSESAQVVVAPGANVTCTFVNARDRGTLTLVKHVINDNGGTAEADDFTLHVKQSGVDVSGSPAAGSESGTVYVLTTGTYTVSEDTPVTGYTQTSVVCDGQPTSTVSVTTDSDKTCTITNDDLAPTLTLVKQVINDNSGTADAEDFTLTADPTVGNTISGDGTVTSDANANTAYSLSESGPDGYHVQTDWNCDGGTFDAQANTVTLALNEDVTCTIVNDDDAHPDIEITKTAQNFANQGETVTYTFSVQNTGDEPLSNVAVTDLLIEDVTYVSGDTNDNEILDLTETWLFTGQYTIPEDQTETVTNVAEVCADPREGEEVCDDDDHNIIILAEVIVTKYNDFNRNGELDDDEPLLPDWEFNLSGQQQCEEVELIQLLIDILVDEVCEDYDYDKTQITGDDGTTTFADVRPGVAHELTESLDGKDGWTLGSIDCGERDGSLDGNTYFFGEDAIEQGETINCFVGNYHDVALLIAKTNDKPAPTTVGDTVTYTLTVTVPEDSGPSYNTTVTDLPPEGFTYVPGSWTATSSVRGDLTPEVTPEPTYGSPGTWLLDRLLPGEVVTLTYRAVIGSAVSPGTYPDVAFALGCEAPVGDCEVLSNVSAGANTPFVASQVSIKSPQVLGAHTTVLVDTGAADVWRNMMVATLLVGLAFATLAKRQKKGYRL